MPEALINAAYFLVGILIGLAGILIIERITNRYTTLSPIKEDEPVKITITLTREDVEEAITHWLVIEHGQHLKTAEPIMDHQPGVEPSYPSFDGYEVEVES